LEVPVQLRILPRIGALALVFTLLTANGERHRLFAQDDEQEEGEDLSQITPRPPAVAPESVPPGSGPVTATPGMSFKKGGLYRFFFGDLNRDLWDIPFEVPVLDLATVAGGLTPKELSGGKQTLGLRFDGADGRIYQFRSIVKDATRGIPGILRVSPVSSIVQDQSSAQFPLGAMVVSEFLEAAGVLVAKPRVVGWIVAGGVRTNLARIGGPHRTPVAT
jgi:hypothetical protein